MMKNPEEAELVFRHEIQPLQPEPLPKLDELIDKKLIKPSEEILSKEELKSAISLIKQLPDKWRRFMKSVTDKYKPKGQTIALISFYPSSGAKPDKNGLFGAVKIRGCFQDVDDAQEHATKIIANYDSETTNYMTLVGALFPFAENPDKYCKEHSEVDVRKHIDQTVRDNLIRSRDNEQKERDQIMERQQMLLNDTKSPPSENSIDKYIESRVKRANLKMFKRDAEEKLKECVTSLDKTTKKIEDLQSEFPEYISTYREKYVKVCEESGIDVKTSPIWYILEEEDGGKQFEKRPENKRIDPSPVELEIQNSVVTPGGVIENIKVPTMGELLSKLTPEQIEILRNNTKR